MQTPKIYRILSIVLSMTMMFGDVSWAVTPQVVMPHQNQDGMMLQSLAHDLQIPSRLGSVQDRHVAAPAKNNEVHGTIIHIQDAHASREAQENIREIISLLEKEYGMDLLFIEGAVEKLDPNRIRRFDDEKLNRELAERLTDEGVVHGTELYLLDKSSKDSPSTMQAYGIEEIKLYEKNLESFRNVYAHKAEADAFLTSSKTRITSAASKIFNKELSGFFRAWAFYQDAPQELLHQLKALQAVAKEKLDIDFLDAHQQIEWPHLVRFFKLQELEKQLDQERIRADHAKLIKWIDGKELETAVREALTGYTPEKGFQKDGNESLAKGVRIFVEHLYDVLQAQGFEFKNYPDLSKAWGYLILSEEIQADLLFEESARLTSLIFDVLAVKAEEKEIISVYKDFLLLEKAFSLHLTPKDYQEALQRKDSLKPSGLIRRLESNEAEKEAVAEMDVVFAEAMAFYGEAIQRDRVMYENMLRRMKETGKQTAVLVTGGFHTDGLNAFFKEAGLDYVQVTPRISQISDEKEYLKIMTLGQYEPKRSYASTWLPSDPAVDGTPTGRFLTGRINAVAGSIVTEQHLQPAGAVVVPIPSELRTQSVDSLTLSEGVTVEPGEEIIFRYENPFRLTNVGTSEATIYTYMGPQADLYSYTLQQVEHEGAEYVVATDVPVEIQSGYGMEAESADGLSSTVKITNHTTAPFRIELTTERQGLKGLTLASLTRGPLEGPKNKYIKLEHGNFDTDWNSDWEVQPGQVRVVHRIGAGTSLGVIRVTDDKVQLAEDFAAAITSLFHEYGIFAIRTGGEQTDNPRIRVHRGLSMVELPLWALLGDFAFEIDAARQGEWDRNGTRWISEWNNIFENHTEMRVNMRWIAVGLVLVAGFVSVPVIWHSVTRPEVGSVEAYVSELPQVDAQLRQHALWELSEEDDAKIAEVGRRLVLGLNTAEIDQTIADLREFYADSRKRFETAKRLYQEGTNPDLMSVVKAEGLLNRTQNMVTQLSKALLGSGSDASRKTLSELLIESGDTAFAEAYVAALMDRSPAIGNRALDALSREDVAKIELIGKAMVDSLDVTELDRFVMNLYLVHDGNERTFQAKLKPYQSGVQPDLYSIVPAMGAYERTKKVVQALSGNVLAEVVEKSGSQWAKNVAGKLQQSARAEVRTWTAWFSDLLTSRRSSQNAYNRTRGLFYEPLLPRLNLANNVMPVLADSLEFGESPVAEIAGGYVNSPYAARYVVAHTGVQIQAEGEAPVVPEGYVVATSNPDFALRHDTGGAQGYSATNHFVLNLVTGEEKFVLHDQTFQGVGITADSFDVSTDGTVSFDVIRTDASGGQTTTSIQVPFGEIQESLPSGFGLARNNAQYATRVRTEDGPQGPRQILEVLDVVKHISGAEDAIQKVAETGTRGSGGSSISYSSQIDVSPEGVIIYAIDAPGHPSLGTVYAKNVSDLSVTGLEISGRLKGISFPEVGRAVITTDSPIALGITEVTDLNLATLGVSQTKLSIVGDEGYFQIDQDTPYVLATPRTQTGGFNLIVFDASNGLDDLTLVTTETVGADSGGQYTYLDVLFTDTGDSVVIASLDLEHSNTTLVGNLNSGSIAHLDGTISGPESLGFDAGSSNGLFAITREDGSQSTVIVNLDTVEILAVTDVTIPDAQFFLRYDVSNDLVISPLDALIVINYLNTHGAGPATFQTSFLDTNGDGNISPLDVLLVINFLNTRGSQSLADFSSVSVVGAAVTQSSIGLYTYGQAEGEAPVQQMPAPSAAQVPLASIEHQRVFGGELEDVLSSLDYPSTVAAVLAATSEVTEQVVSIALPENVVSTILSILDREAGTVDNLFDVNVREKIRAALGEFAASLLDRKPGVSIDLLIPVPVDTAPEDLLPLATLLSEKGDQVTILALGAVSDVAAEFEHRLRGELRRIGTPIRFVDAIHVVGVSSATSPALAEAIRQQSSGPIRTTVRGALSRDEIALDLLGYVRDVHRIATHMDQVDPVTLALLTGALLREMEAKAQYVAINLDQWANAHYDVQKLMARVADAINILKTIHTAA